MHINHLQSVYIPEGADLNLELIIETDPLISALIKARIDPDKEPEQNPVLFQIGDADVFSAGDFSCVTGKAKSKKTFLITLFIAAFLKQTIGPFKVKKFPNKKRIVWFDTEQSEYHVFKAFKRALALSSGGKLYDIEVYDLRPYSPKERQEMINFLLMTDNVQKNIAFVVIDGIRDLVTDINDPEQATKVTTWLMQVTALAELHVCTVLHQNKGDNNARGHLGTEIINKAQTVLSVQKVTGSENVSLVKAEQCRGKEFNDFAFSINAEGLPYLLEDYTPNEQGESKRKLIPSDIPLTTHREIIGKIFIESNEITRADLITNIKIMYHKYDVVFGESKAREFLEYCRQEGIIKHNGSNTKNARYLLGN